VLPSQPPARGSGLLQHRALLPHRSLRRTVSTSTLVATACPLLLPQSTFAETPGPCSCIAHSAPPPTTTAVITRLAPPLVRTATTAPFDGSAALIVPHPYLRPSLARSTRAEQPPERQHLVICLCHSDRMAALGERSAIVAAGPQTPRVDAPTTEHTAIARVARTRTPNRSLLQAPAPCPWKGTLS
jgi:hypothetical protein